MKIINSKSGLWVMYGFLIIFLIISAFPYLWTFLTSIKQSVDAFAIPPVWKFQPTALNYYKIWIQEPFFHYLKNSAIVAAGTLVISLTIGSLAGYGIARYSKVGGFFLLLLSLVFRALPRIVFTLPFYYISRILGIYDTTLVLILVMVAINQPFTIWILRSFFMNVPEEMEEAAMIDGCTRFQAFRKVIVPIMGPGIVSAGIFTLLLAYNSYLLPTVLTSTNAKTLTVAIAQFGAKNIKYWSMMAAGNVSIALPIVLIVLFGQKYIVKGLTAGSVKG